MLAIGLVVTTSFHVHAISSPPKFPVVRVYRSKKENALSSRIVGCVPLRRAVVPVRWAIILCGLCV